MNYKMNGVKSKLSNGTANAGFAFCPEYLLNTDLSNSRPFGVMILNRPINLPLGYVMPFWNRASVRVTVDGGTNRWLSFLERNHVDSSKVANIDIVCGDFDSVTENVLQNIKCNNLIQVVHTPDQNETDFTKALQLLSSYCREKNMHIDAVLVICENSGRIDQIIGNINTLHKYHLAKWMDAELYMMSDDSLSWLLDKGTSNIHIPEALLKDKNTWCALMPIGSKAVVSSSGLKWNLNRTVMEFGGLVSTSNAFANSKMVTVTTDAVLVWTMNIIPFISKHLTKSE